METRSTASADTASRFLALPDRFLAMRRLSTVTSGGNTDIVYMAPEELQVPGVSGLPRFFTVTTQLEFDKTPDSDYIIEMAYLAKLLPLDDTNISNAILADAPHIYLYGSLWALFQYAADEEKAEYYYGKFINSIRGANKQDKHGRYGPAPKMRIEGHYP